MPLISVVMPVWNGEQYLRASVDSVLAQTFSDLELVVIDDGSTDKTLEILKSYADPRLRILETAHGGIVQALNFGIAQAKGEWIARLDADDIALPERLARQLERLRQEPKACLCYSDAEFIGSSIGRPGPSRLPNSRAFLAMRMCFKYPFVHSSVMFSKKAFQKAGGYLEAERHAEDFGLWGRMLELAPMVAIREPLVKFRFHDQSISKQKAEEQNAVAERIAREHCRRFMQIDSDEAARAFGLLRRSPVARPVSDWLWFLRRCVPRFRWKSAELLAWLANRTVLCLRRRSW